MQNLRTENLLTKSVILLMALGTGIAVANLYYMQPLLADISVYFKISMADIGIIAMLTQLGYAFGILFITPLADIFEKKKLILTIIIFSIFSLFIIFISNNFFIISIGAFLIGLFTIIPQLIIPFAAKLCNPQARGKIIGIITSGMLMGILLSRTFSGIIGNKLGWKSVYMFSAVMMLILFFTFKKILPKSMPINEVRYFELIKSFPMIFNKYHILRESSLNGAMMFSAFTMFWTNLIFLLKSSYYNMGTDIAGMFGLLGIVGVLAAPLIGNISDKKTPRFTVGVGIVMTFISYFIFNRFGYNILGLIVGVIILDIGIQACVVANQSRVQSISDEYRARINAIYMFFAFLGGAAGSAISPIFFKYYGWHGLCFIGIVTQIIAFLFHVYSKRNYKISNNLEVE